jgi:branched-chain amino acid transport system ATP-binding protein
MRAVRIITDEHRALTAVLHGMLSVLRHVRYGISEPDFELLDAMLYYIRAFPERFHHPKEDAYLFRLLRERHPAISPLLDKLHVEHQVGTVRLQQMEEALARYAKERSTGLAAFYGAVADYAAFQYAHVRAEEDEVLPAAAEHLTAADWTEIDDAFSGHTNPLFGAEAGNEYDELFRRIVALAPAPLGAAPDTSAKGRRAQPS